MSEPSSVDLEQLIARYAESAAAHRAASESGDYKLANKQYAIIARTHKELLQRGNHGRARLLELLTHESAGVRGWAAAHALEFAPAEAEPVLIELSNAVGTQGMSARMTLREWRAGRLRFP